MNPLFKLIVFVLGLGLIDGKPQQIHISLGANPTEMMVTFTSFTKSDKSLVRYNKVNGPVKTVDTHQTKFDDKKYSAHIHRALLTGLEPGQEYEYQCNTDDQWSNIYRFRAVTNRTDVPIKLAVYGDLGLENGVSTPQLKKDVKQGLYDAVFHIGDIAYDLDDNDGTVGDKFMEGIEEIAATRPYQTCPGNHEHKKNFTHYLNRFSMIDSKSGQINNHYHSFNLGPAHFIFYSTELYYYPQHFTESHIEWQYKWLENDLKEANKPENRDQRPWIIVHGHRPMYCLETSDDCFHFESTTRTGRTGDDLHKSTAYPLEDLFYKYRVDIQFYGHNHAYERSYPIYNMNYTKTSTSAQLYDNPKEPIHIITGAAGPPDRDALKANLPSWVAFLSHDWSFTRMTVQNKSHIFFEQFSTENNKIVDSFVIRKDRH